MVTSASKDKRTEVAVAESGVLRRAWKSIIFAGRQLAGSAIVLEIPPRSRSQRGLAVDCVHCVTV